MKIAIDCHTLEVKNWAGKGHFLNTILQELIKLDKETQYILYFRQPVFKQPLPANWQIKSIRLPTPLWQLYVLLDLLFKRVNVLFCPSAYLLPALNFLIPQVIVVCDLTTFLPEIKKTHKKGTRLREGLLLKLAAKHSRKIITISENSKKDLIRFFRVNPQKVAVVLLASHSDYRVIENRSAIKDILAKHNLPEQFILCTGTLEPRKNIVRLIKAYLSFSL
jgi:glycosyltransferase involved in cell wall biosynthesis